MSDDRTRTVLQSPSPGPCWSRVVLVVVLGGIGCAVDLVTKQRLFAWLGPPRADGSPVYWLWEGFFGFQTSINTGALFGLGQDRVGLLAAISLVALAGIGYWLIWGGGTRDFWVTLALGLILGGVLGNLYDRLGLWGVHGVRDWILVSYQYPRYIWPNFNIADSLLVCGAGLLVLRAFTAPEDASPPAAANGAPNLQKDEQTTDD